jgi:GxxExxY protein
MAMDFIYADETYKIIGAGMTVHNELGRGFLEAVYQEALAKEFALQDISYEKEKHIQIFYKGQELSKYYIADFVCYDKIIVEIKAVSSLLPEHTAQVLNYLKATKQKIGLLLNFGASKLEYERLIL